ncbi:ubiquinone biosynthesis accessory factor UbiJ [Zhongshania arctica]|uniref:Ubiquinone biosynthesis accessory factor UbiJ n=1 Tax=Zhongshania arctica TaxID=3238302 RepID=A0ABV3TUJ9_9GAMM
MIPPVLQSAALSSLENLVNKALQLDPATSAKLQALNGQRFSLELKEPDLNIGIGISGKRLRILGQHNDEVTTRLSGRWSEFAKVATATDPAAALINGDISISGDTGPLLELRKILAELDLDWEQPLADAFGDVAAHQLGNGLRAGQRWFNSTRANLHRQFSEFIVEESQLVPHPCQADDFYSEVDELKVRSERLEAKIRRLQQRIATSNKN